MGGKWGCKALGKTPEKLVGTMSKHCKSAVTIALYREVKCKENQKYLMEDKTWMQKICHLCYHEIKSVWIPTFMNVKLKGG